MSLNSRQVTLVWFALIAAMGRDSAAVSGQATVRVATHDAERRATFGITAP